MSDESDFEPQNRCKRTACPLEDVPSSSSRGSISNRKRNRRIILNDSDSSDSGSSIEMQRPRKRIPRVTSDDGDSDSSGSVIVIRSKRTARVVSDSGSDGDDSDHGFEGSSSSQYETEVSENESTNPNTVKVQDTGVDSDSSDGQSEKCPICLLSFTNQEIGTPESCDHIFCVECIQEWSKNVNTCPVDRQEYQMILVRKNINGKIYKQIPIERPNQENDVNIVEDLTFCEVCGLSDREDRMLLCDGCDLGFHLECLHPPLAEIPAGAWFCNDCSPEDLVNQEVELYELQLLLDDVHDFEMHPAGFRRRTSARSSTSRLMARTRQTERVRRRIVTNRSINEQTNPTPGPAAQPVSSTTVQRKPKKKKKRKTKSRYRIVYEMDEATGETVAIKKRIKRRKKKTKKKKVRVVSRPKTVKKRLALQLGMCRPRSVAQNLPDVKVQTHVNNIQSQRYQAGIPTLSLFGPPQDMNLFSDSDDEVDDGGILIRRAPNRGDVAAMRRARVKAINIPNPAAVSSTTSDLLESILESQTKFHSKNTVFSLGENGKILAEKSRNPLALNNHNQGVRQRPTFTNTSTDSVPSSSGSRSDYQTNASTSEHSNSGIPTSSTTAESNISATTQTNTNSNENEKNVQMEYNQSGIFEGPEKDKKKKKLEETSENNTPRTGTPGSESEIDIYSDIETVSTSKVDDSDYKVASPAVPHNASDEEENNDSETDMVIDTEKQTQESEENTKEETTVTSTVDSNVEEASEIANSVTSTSEIQSEAIQSTSNQLFSDKSEQVKEDDEESEDECPNFSIYSKESITMAKNTDISLGPEMKDEENNQSGEISSSPVNDVKPSEADNLPKKLKSNSGDLYSDSEDETFIKRENSFAIADIRNMTEDISEEERSYTPCLDERGPHFREGIEGLDTEMISDEERNDFDESHDLKTASDGDALEINAKESELDFTRPEDYEEGEIVDKNKQKKTEEVKKAPKPEEPPKKVKKEESDVGNKENENVNTNNKESSFKKLSKNNKERNYRDKERDRDRSKSRERKQKVEKDVKKERKKEKRKEIERYDVRALIADKPRRLKDKFGRDIRRSGSRSKTRSPASPRRSPSRSRRSPSKTRRSPSKSRRSPSKGRRSVSRSRKRQARSKNRRSASRSKSRSTERKRSRSKTNKKRRRSPSRERRRKSRDRSKVKAKKPRSRSRHRTRSPTPKRGKDWKRRQSRDWTPSLSRSRTPDTQRHLTPSWTPPRIMDSSVKPHNLTVILTNDANKKKKEKKRKNEKKTKENERQKKRKRDRTPPPSKEVFASGDNILVSVSFNKETETRDISTKRKQRENVEQQPEPPKKQKKEKRVKTKPKKIRDLSGVKPVAIIDLARSPFKELTPSPKDVIVLSDSDSEEQRNKAAGICDSSQQVASPERNTYSLGPKTPPEPQIKFTVASKQTQMRAITNPLHEPDDVEPEEGDAEEVSDGHKGPNTPPDPPNSPPSSPDAYDPFEPTKSRSPTPEAMQTTQSNSSNMDDNHDDNLETNETEKSNNSVSLTPDQKSHTPPLADVQPADSQSSIHATPESSKSPTERSSSSQTSGQVLTSTASKPIAQTIPFSSVPTSIITSTPINSNLTAQSRINILNSTIIASTHTSSGLPQRIVLPTTVKSSPVKISPTKAAVKSTPIKPMPKSIAAKTSRKSTGNRNQNGGSDNTVDASLSFDSPYSPGSSDYEDLFEPPAETIAKASKPVKKSPNKVQNTFDSLFGTSPFNKNKPKTDNKTKFNKKPASSQNKGNTKQVGVKLDEDNLKILDDLPNSAVEMQVKDKFLKKLNRQERVVEEVKLVLKPHYNKKHITKEEYKDILRRAVPKICHNKTGEINPTKIKNLIEAYVKKVRHSKKVTSSSSVNPQKV